MSGDVPEILDVKARTDGIGGTGGFGRFQIGAQDVEGFGIAVVGAVACHRGQPVAKEHVDVAFGKASVGKGHRQNLRFGLPAEAQRTRVEMAVVEVMSIQPTSENRILSQPSAKAFTANT